MRIPSAVATMLAAIFFASNVWPQVIEHVRFDPPPGDMLHPGRQIMVEFNYALEGPEGGFVFLVPLSAGKAVEHYDARSLRVNTGNGTARAWFTVQQGPARIDEVLLRMIDGRKGETLLETKIPAKFEFRGKKGFKAVFVEALGKALQDALDEDEREPSVERGDELGAKTRTACTGNCKDVTSRNILPDGTVRLECADGSSRSYLPDGKSSHTNPSGEACELFFTYATQVPPAEAPEPPDVWVASVARWITNANEVLLGGIRAVAGAEATKNYQEYERTEASSPYDRADLRLRYLRRLTEVE